MTHRVHIEPGAYEFMVDDNETILDAALRQGYHFPHLCRNAMCGTCKGQLTAGEITYQHDNLPALSDEEKAEQWVLCCQAIPTTDVSVTIEHVSAPTEFLLKKYQADVTQVNALTSDVAQVFLKITSEPFQYVAGQYLEIIIDDTHRYPFSIANAPLEDNVLELQIKHNIKDSFATTVLSHLQNNSSVQVLGPFGKCTLKASKKPVIFLAGGSGYAPIKAMIEGALSQGSKRPMILYWGVREASEFYQATPWQWAKHIKNFSFVPVVSDIPSDDKAHRFGLVHEALKDDLKEKISEYDVYTAGPPAMVYQAKEELCALGLPEDAIFSDLFDY